MNEIINETLENVTEEVAPVIVEAGTNFVNYLVAFGSGAVLGIAADLTARHMLKKKKAKLNAASVSEADIVFADEIEDPEIEITEAD